MNDQHPRSGKFVCATCLEDEALHQFAAEKGMTLSCDYCGKTPSAPCVVRLSDVTDFMGKAIAEEWCDPAQTSPVDGGQYWLQTIDTHELFERIDLKLANQELMDDLLAAFSDNDWCDANWGILSPSQRWGCGWDTFQRVVKHQRRYTFWDSRGDLEDVSHPDSLPPSDVLKEIAVVIGRTEMMKTFPEGRLIWRLRLHERSETLEAPHKFTPPPIENATQPNRMSPSGIPMFYGADDFETAFLELVAPTDPETKNKFVSGAQFRTAMPLNLLDLTSIPPAPSYFSPDGRFLRHRILLLRKFAIDVSQPIQSDRRQHIEYVPTQVFTEFVRHNMTAPDGSPFHGIRYSSSINGQPCYVIFATQQECLQRDPLAMSTQKLEFVSGSIKTVPVP